MLEDPFPGEALWCDDRMWTDYTVHYDLRVHEPIGSLWGLPLLIPTCLRLFAQGVRLKYVDVFTDTLHASSSDLITWNTLAVIKYGRADLLRKEWLVVTHASMKSWQERDLMTPF